MCLNELGRLSEPLYLRKSPKPLSIPVSELDSRVNTGVNYYKRTWLGEAKGEEMQIYDNRERKDLIKPPYGLIINVEGSSGAGSVSVVLAEGYTVTIGYEEMEKLADAMEGYTGKLGWGK